MPWSPKSPCQKMGCRTLTKRDYCPKHTRKDTRPYSNKRGYDAGWRKLRWRFLREHPYCAGCGEPAKIADHIIPKKLGGADRISNLQALCQTCHNRKTSQGL